MLIPAIQKDHVTSDVELDTTKIQRWKGIVDQNRPHFLGEKSGRTFFDIAGRGHYENPLSDLLAFFLNPRNEHALGSAYLRAFFSAIGKSPDDLHVVGDPWREMTTDSGKRMDIVVHGYSWILAIESKVWHRQVNPFTEYEKHIRTHYVGAMQRVEEFFIVLSPGGSTAPSGWIPLSFTQLARHIEAEVSKQSPCAGKWDILSQELVAHLYQLGGRQMNDATKEFICAHAADIDLMALSKSRYVNALSSELANTMSARLKSIVSKEVVSWGDWCREVIYLRPEPWDGVRFAYAPSTNGQKGICVYLYGIPGWNPDFVITMSEKIGIPWKYDDIDKKTPMWIISNGVSFDATIQKLMDVADMVQGFLKENVPRR